MKEIKVRLRSVQDVQDFVAIATARPFPIWVGSPDHWVNGKSFMELFCLNYSDPQTVSFECGEPELGDLLQDAPRFLAE